MDGQEKRGLAARRGKHDVTLMDEIDLDDLPGIVLPALGAYYATNLLGRITHRYLSTKNIPYLSEHGHVIASAGAFALSWLTAHKWSSRMTREQYLSVVIGAFLGAVRTALRTYCPTHGWVVGDGDNRNELPPHEADADGGQGRASSEAAPSAAPPARTGQGIFRSRRVATRS